MSNVEKTTKIAREAGLLTDNSVYWEFTESMDGKLATLTKHIVWTKPMIFYHALRKIAIGFDKAAAWTRNLIHRFEEDKSPGWNNKTGEFVGTLYGIPLYSDPNCPPGELHVMRADGGKEVINIATWKKEVIKK